MKELNELEVTQVSGGDASFKGMVYGAMDGFATGALAGGKWAGAGGVLFGALAQLVGTIIGGVGGVVIGSTVGLVDGPEASAAFWQNYKDSFGPGDLGVTQLF